MDSHLSFSGKFYFELVRNGKVVDKWALPNDVTIEGRRHLLEVSLNNVAAINPWYIGIFQANVTPDENYVAAELAGTNNVNEIPHLTGYEETTRQEYDCALHATAGSLSNAVAYGGTLATFTFLNPYTVYGAFLASASTAAGDSTGTLMAISEFAARSVIAEDQLNITYEISTTTT